MVREVLVRSTSLCYTEKKGGLGMAHEEYVRIVPGAHTAVLFVHGIVGTPNHFRDLIPLQSLVPQTWSVCNVLLDGHGSGVDDFSGTSMRKWKQQIRKTFLRLCQEHDSIVLVGHSMGTLLVLELAADYPEKVSGLFLLACPLYVGLRLGGVVNCIKVALGTVDAHNPREAATLKACGVNPDRRLWKYLGWIPRMLELLAEIRHTRRMLPDIQVPCLALQSDRDELVSGRSAGRLEKAEGIQVIHLKESSHFYYTAVDAQRILDAFAAFCERMEKQD